MRQDLCTSRFIIVLCHVEQSRNITSNVTIITLCNFENSRFGSAIVNLGDLQNDGFEDFAVGAPFEGNGVVYIYRGSINPKATLEKGWISKTYNS